VLSSLASFRNPAKPCAAAQENHGQSPLCRHSFNGQKGPLVDITFIFQETGQPTLAKNSSSQCEQPLCWKEILLHQQDLSGREKSLECSRVEQDPTTPCHLVNCQRNQGRPPCLLLLTEHAKPAPRQAQPHRSRNPGTNMAHRIQKNILQMCKISQKLSERKSTLPPLISKSLQVSPAHPMCSLPAPAPHKHDFAPTGLSKPACKQAPAMQPNKFSQGKLRFTLSSPAQLCCGQ